MRYLSIAGLVVGGFIFARGLANGNRADTVLGGFAVVFLVSQVLAERLGRKGRLGWWLLLWGPPLFLLKMPPAFFTLMVYLMLAVVVLHFIFPPAAGDEEAMK